MVINQIARVRCPGFDAPAVLPTIPYEIPGLTRDWTSQRKNALEPGPDDDRIVSHDAPRFMLYYHCVRDTL